MSTLDPRKALETRLDDLHAVLLAIIPPEYQQTFDPADKVPIWWTNYTWTKEDERHLVYLKPSFETGDGRFPELGRNSRKDVPGHMLIGIYTPAGSGTDLPSLLAAAIETAYPYATDIPTNGGTVEITNVVERRGAGTPDGRWFTPVHINFMVWRSR